MRVNWFRTVLLAAVVAGVVAAAIGIGLANIRPLWQPSAVVGQQVTQTLQQPAPPLTTSTGGDAGPKSESHWAVDLAGKVAWPVTVLLILLLVTFSSRLRRLFGAGTKMVRRVNAGGVEMEINAESVAEVRKQLRDSFHELVGNARDEYQRMADLQDIELHLATVIQKEIAERFAGSLPPNARATVHVRDIIFRDYLYQLVGYYPSGGGAHRRFSQRYGIIGRSWRSGVSHGTGNAFGASPSEDALVEEWGMTREEAHGVINSRPSCLSVILRSSDIAVGILYIDSTKKDAFGADKAALAHANELETSEHVVRLAAAVDRALAPLKAAGPNLDIKELG